jgi:hypothetical protein
MRLSHPIGKGKAQATTPSRVEIERAVWQD